ncbi:MAG: sortase [Candidatus Kaiserbacteria bacterium]|nr:sortase [Candidatus Kaiserbacteria bacterium]
MDMTIINLTARFIRACERAYIKKWSFLGLSALVFLGSVSTLGQLDLLPTTTAKVEASVPVVVSTNTEPQVVSELPTKIVIPAINLSTTIANPTTIDTEILDQGLLKGAVRYPTSAKLGETGNVILFGHSSYLPIVNNQAYKTFNGIQKLSAGDVIMMYSSGATYTYQVRSVEKQSANSATIPLSVAGKVLTLSTCDSFGVKTDRFVVVADFVESHSIST